MVRGMSAMTKGMGVDGMMGSARLTDSHNAFSAARQLYHKRRRSAHGANSLRAACQPQFSQT